MKKLTIEFVRSEFEKDGYELLSEEYINAHQKLEYICKNKHKHSICWNHWKNNKRCPYCVGNARLTIDFIKIEFGKEGYILLTKKYINNEQKLDYICPKRHKYFMSWANWISDHRCVYCSKRPPINLEFVRSEFAKENYILLSNEYINAHQRLDYMCSRGHKHFMMWNDWQQRTRCPICSVINRSGKNHYNWKDGISSINNKLRNFIRSIGWPDKIFRRDDYICQRCNKRGGKLVAHHLIPLSRVRKYFSISTMEDAEKYGLLSDTSNGVTLCEDCHKWVHSDENISSEFLRSLTKAMSFNNNN